MSDWQALHLLANQGGSPWGTLPLLVIIFAVFWFLMIAPMRKKEKKLQEFRSSLKNGDRVITQGGIFGTIVGVEDSAVKLRIADNVKITVLKSTIAGLQQPEGEAGETKG